MMVSPVRYVRAGGICLVFSLVKKGVTNVYHQQFL